MSNDGGDLLLLFDTPQLVGIGCMPELQDVVGKFVGGHTLRPEIVGASLVDALCCGYPVLWMPCVVDALCCGCPISRQGRHKTCLYNWRMPHIQTGQAQDLPLQLETIGGLGVE